MMKNKILTAISTVMVLAPLNDPAAEILCIMSAGLHTYYDPVLCSIYDSLRYLYDSCLYRKNAAMRVFLVINSTYAVFGIAAIIVIIAAGP